MHACGSSPIPGKHLKEVQVKKENFLFVWMGVFLRGVGGWHVLLFPLPPFLSFSWYSPFGVHLRFASSWRSVTCCSSTCIVFPRWSDYSLNGGSI